MNTGDVDDLRAILDTASLPIRRQTAEDRRALIKAWLNQRRDEQAGTFVTPGLDLGAA